MVLFRRIYNLYIFFLVTLLFSTSGRSQIGYGFGQNKVHYKNFDWAIFSTTHFDVYYYSEEAEAAHDAARMAERGYNYLSEVLNHKFKRKIPLILYSSLNDFQQTNVVQGMLGDGTRGVTESLKNRVVLPITGSYREFNHVLVHELVHAFQFDIMSSNSGRMNSQRFNPPLWFVEGMAEYLSNGMDNTTRMWVRDGLTNKSLLSVDQLNNTFDIRVYRIGQALWYYIGETYGKDKIGEILKAAVMSGNIQRALERSIGLDQKALTAAWHKSMEILVRDNSLDSLESNDFAERLTTQKNFYHRMNLIPAVSPDGESIAYIANKNLVDEIFVLSLDENGKYKQDRIIKGGRSKSFESLRFFSSSMNWSRDGKLITFVTKSGKDDALYVVDPFTKKVIHRFIFDELNGLQSPSFSPDNNQIAFVGMRGGRSDLYTYDLRSDHLKKITNDRFAVLHPQWSPNGRYIAYSSDRGEGTDREKLLFGDYDLVLYDILDDDVDILTNLKGNVINPQWSPTGDEIAFISEHTGVPNIFRLNLQTQEISAVTNLKNGVSGITESTPAFSWSANGRVMVFSTFEKMSWQLYRLELEDTGQLLATKYLYPASGDFSSGAMSPLSVEEYADDDSLQVALLPPVTEPNNIYEKYELVEPDSIISQKYRSRFRLDGIALGASFGGFFGSSGGGQLLFSDMLGNRNLFVSAGIQFNDILNSDLGVTYFNQSRRLNYGVQLYQIGSAFASFITPDGFGFVREIYRGGNFFAVYPFSRFSRIELSTGATIVDQDQVVDTFNGRDFDRTTRDIGSFTFGQFGMAYVFDNTIYGPLGPLNGSRARFSVEQAVNDLSFTMFFGDYRRYISVNHRSVIAWRVMGGSSIGRDEQFFRIGGPYSYRGSDYGDLIGSKFIVQNLEYRFPLLPFLPPTADFLSGFSFLDAAAAWGVDIPGFVKEEFQPFSTEGGFQLKDLRAAVGVGARLSFGFLTLQYHFAWPTNAKNFGRPINQFSIGTFF